MYNICADEDHSRRPIIGYCMNKQCSETPQFCLQCLTTKHESHKTDCKEFVQFQYLIRNSVRVLRNYQERLAQSFQRLYILKDQSDKFLFRQQEKLIEIEGQLQENQFEELSGNLDLLNQWNQVNEQGKNHDSKESDIEQKLANVNEIIEIFTYLTNLLSSEQERKRKDFEQMPSVSLNLFTETTSSERRDISNKASKLKTFHCSQEKNRINIETADKQRQAVKDLDCYEKAADGDDTKAKVQLMSSRIKSASNHDKILDSTLKQVKSSEERLNGNNQQIIATPRNSVSYNSKGEPLKYLKKYQEAFTNLDKVINVDPEDPNCYIVKGNTLSCLGLNKAAVKYYQIASEKVNRKIVLWKSMIEKAK